MSDSTPANTDIVFVDTLQLSANIGADCWGRSRPQIVFISVFLHLHNSFLTQAGESDDVGDSVHYGHLTKSITEVVNSTPDGFPSVRHLINAVILAAYSLTGAHNVAAVRVVANVPKLILLADGFSVDITLPQDFVGTLPATVVVKDLVLAVIIGVNPPEREAKQRVITTITFFECGITDYPPIIKQIAQEIEQTSYLTLEKFVMEVVRSACLSSENIQAVTVRSQKPSALTFAHSSGVEITRRRDAFVDGH
ncbi:tetrahydrobiopterin biosynthesis enzymes-like protein [Leucogyrophana mollusca]|uniref:Tetrahydrobiopterin biosynthesis enzymes-like protein n=1 Tax=Leucogyrophana mollusca TaxID=85980 RepID=A0ACB8BBU7_9AGAM|nr:tetrahydrobiopterin biosynthesis enzymes-like protein [Leucogyrophana mollusca]